MGGAHQCFGQIDRLRGAAAGLALAGLRLRRAIAATGLLVSLAALAGVAMLPQQPIMLMSAIALIAVVWNAIGGALLLMAGRAQL